MASVFRCMSETCDWEGPREDGVYRAVGDGSHIFCPRCFHPCRAAAVAPVKKRRVVQEAVDDESPRTCSKCGFRGVVRDFGKTTSRGKMLIRSWCQECLKGYYRGRNRKAAAGKGGE